MRSSTFTSFRTSALFAAALTAAALTASAPLVPGTAVLRAQQAADAKQAASKPATADPAEESQQQPQARPRPVPLFTWRDAALMAGFAASALAIAPLDLTIAERLQQPTVQENRFLGDVAAVVRNVATPGSVIIGLGMYGIGRATKNDKAADLGLHGTEALFIGEALGVVLKGTFGRARPYHNPENPRDYQVGRGFQEDTKYRSFPSGHTIAAFAAAAAVTSETRRWWPKAVWVIAPTMYGGAALAGASRMYNNRHWASDVVVGAAIGTFAGIKVVRWHHSRPGNAIDRLLLGGSVRKMPDGSTVLQYSTPSPF